MSEKILRPKQRSLTKIKRHLRDRNRKRAHKQPVKATCLSRSSLYCDNSSTCLYLPAPTDKWTALKRPGICFFLLKITKRMCTTSCQHYLPRTSATCVSSSCRCQLLPSAKQCSRLLSVLTASFSFAPCLGQRSAKEEPGLSTEAKYNQISARNFDYYSKDTSFCKDVN